MEPDRAHFATLNRRNAGEGATLAVIAAVDRESKVRPSASMASWVVNGSGYRRNDGGLELRCHNYVELRRSYEVPPSLPHYKGSMGRVAAGLEPNLTKNLLARWLAPGGEPCKDSKTREAGRREPRLRQNGGYLVL
ncbi:hypothetical protein ACFX12_035805 [Malus domestica]